MEIDRADVEIASRFVGEFDGLDITNENLDSVKDVLRSKFFLPGISLGREDSVALREANLDQVRDYISRELSNAGAVTGIYEGDTRVSERAVDEKPQSESDGPKYWYEKDQYA